MVEGQSQYVTSEGMVFMPDEKTRKMASNGFSLLDMMAIPGLNVDRVEGTVKTAADNDVSFSSITSLPAPPRCVGLRLRMYAV